MNDTSDFDATYGHLTPTEFAELLFLKLDRGEVPEVPIDHPYLKSHYWEMFYAEAVWSLELARAADITMHEPPSHNKDGLIIDPPWFVNRNVNALVVQLQQDLDLYNATGYLNEGRFIGWE